MKVPQPARLLHYLETHPEGITTLSAMENLRILRISERIRDLESLGYLIEHIRERTQGGAYVVRYRLIREKEAA